MRLVFAAVPPEARFGAQGVRYNSWIGDIITEARFFCGMTWTEKRRLIVCIVFFTV